MPQFYISSEHDISICTVIPDTPDLNSNWAVVVPCSESPVPPLANHTWFFIRSLSTYWSSWSERTAYRCIAVDIWFRNIWGEYMATLFPFSFWSCFLHTTSYKINFPSSSFSYPNPFQCNALGWLTPTWTCKLHLASLIVGLWGEVYFSPMSLPPPCSSSSVSTSAIASVSTMEMRNSTGK